MKRISDKAQWEELVKYEKLFIKQKQFPPFPRPYEDRIIPIMHTGYLMFIRNKFLFLGLVKNLRERNLYSAYAILKSYWENVATFGYYFLEISNLLNEEKKEEAFIVSRKMGLGGRGFLTKEMVKEKGHNMEDFTIPKISKMMRIVDTDWKKILGEDSDLFKGIYDWQIAEGGHTTYIGLNIAARWLSNKSQLPDVKKSWDKEENSSLLNLAVLSSLVFFYYWNKFQDLKQSDV